MRFSYTIKLLAVLFAVVVTSCNWPVKKHNWVIPDKPTADDSLRIVRMQSWGYSDSVGIFTSVKTYYADLLSKAPVLYDDSKKTKVYCYLHIKYVNGENYCSVELSKGAFDFTSSDCRIRFDNKQPERYRIYDPVKNNTSVLGFYGADTLVDKIKSAAKVLVEADLANGEQKVFEFDTHGLFWEHMGKYSVESLGQDSIPEKYKHWNYVDTTDIMSSKMFHKANIFSEKAVDCYPAFRGTTYAHIEIENEDECLAGIFFDRGAVERNCNSLKVQFDNGPAEHYRVLFPESKKAYILQFYEADKFIEQVKKAKKISVEVPMIKAGTKKFDFNVEGLKWPYKSKPVPNAGKNISAGSVQPSTHKVDWVDQFFANLKAQKKSASVKPSANGSGITVFNVKENVDTINNIVSLNCTCKNSGNEEKNVILKASFMNAGGSIISVKEISVTCSGNMELTATLSASGIAKSYKTYKLEVE